MRSATTPPLRCCLLSGGASRRMGRDKALLPHPEADTWLERQLRLLAGLGAPVSLLSGWPVHRERAAGLVASFAALGTPLELLPEPEEPPPGDGSTSPRGERRPAGPLVALAHLMAVHPEARLLLCPIDLPALGLAHLKELLTASRADPDALWIAAPDHPALPPQPLVGLYPSDAARRQRLGAAVERGERGLRRWLAAEVVRIHPLPAMALTNVNTEAELAAWQGAITPPPDWPGSR
ncbi:MAG: NTP transferase domain-containing protein [Cyanobacteriota bacterium]|nr:NTP transferase domain-containing protein [Cyanobacteriota bacterium]